MKNVITNTKKGFLMVTMFATMLSFANESSFYTIKNDAKKTSLTLESVKKGSLLSIKDGNGLILYKEFIQKSGVYTKGFDLSTLPNGTYVFELDSDVEIKTIPFTVKSSTVAFEKDLELTIFKPVVRVENDMVFVSKLALNKEDLKIDVYFESMDSLYTSTAVYTETVENTKKIERVFKLTGLDEGRYKMVFTSEGREYTEYIGK
ncbi:hypothetical protein GCM10022291_17630 [Postechiella marina]|uniref:Por secretion system C-terminal sorting domain-containing protein n=1 Tax=Postechiella marina TaxID=943941 RepID=A0ABP8C8C7_9FLAO